jgi:hypothetical protein
VSFDHLLPKVKSKDHVCHTRRSVAVDQIDFHLSELAISQLFSPI